jgi:hypothetical protein
MGLLKTATTRPSFQTREECLAQIAKMSDETLRIIAELSTRPMVEQKLKEKEGMIKMFL